MARVADWRMPYPDKYITGHYGTMSDFRRKNGMQAHSGTDWARPLGTRIPAIAKGTIRLIQYSKVLGWVLVQTAMDKDGKVWYIGYCHMDKQPTLKVGDKLKIGQEIGKVGNTGFSSGPHLHATLSPTVKGVFSGTVLDLYKYLQENTEKPSTGRTEPQNFKETAKIVHACPHCGKELKK